jgi:hypothetical protein
MQSGVRWLLRAEVEWYRAFEKKMGVYDLERFMFCNLYQTPGTIVI